MAAVVAIKDEQLLARAQTGKGSELRLVRGRMLGQDVVLLRRNDPASARAWQHAQGARSNRATRPDSHVHRRERIQSVVRWPIPSERSSPGPSAQGSLSRTAVIATARCPLG